MNDDLISKEDNAVNSEDASAYHASLTWEDIQIDYQTSKQNIGSLRDKIASVVEALDNIEQTLDESIPVQYELFKIAKYDPSATPIVYSGYQFIHALSLGLAEISRGAANLYVPVSLYSVSSGSYAGTIEAASTLYNLGTRPFIYQFAIPNHIDENEHYFAILNSLDHTISRDYRIIWDILNAPSPERWKPALFQMRQVFDEFFDILAPDERVRASEFWSKKEGEKPNEVFRIEKIKYAATHWIKTIELRELFIANGNFINAVYKKANYAHNRKQVNEEKAEKIFKALYSVLSEWLDAIDQSGYYDRMSKTWVSQK